MALHHDAAHLFRILLDDLGHQRIRPGKGIGQLAVQPGTPAGRAWTVPNR
jgi:hypothetical protein